MRLRNFLSLLFFAALVFQGSGVLAQGTFVTTPVPFMRWEPIPEKDIAWKKRVWRDLDIKGNAPLVTPATNDNDGSKEFINVLMDGVKDGTIQAYNPKDDGRFLNKMSYDAIAAQLSNSTLVATINTEAGERVGVCVKAENLGAAVTGYRIKEDWLYLKDKKKMVVRIVGIAPVIMTMGEDGTVTEKVPFWVYYPDYRGYFASYMVPDTNGKSSTMTWDEYFESRQFSSKITNVKESENTPHQ